MMERPDRTSWGFRVGPGDDPDRYELGPAVGSGAEGILYRGNLTTSSGLALEVAIKMLQPRFMGEVDQWHTRWAEQLELLRSLQVPGLVPVRDGFVGPLPHAPGVPGEGRTLYLVMNWVEGESLDEWVRHRPGRDPIDDLKVLIPVAAALDLMHSGRATGGVPVAHRDVKPSNILVTDAGTVLVDFGLTRGLPGGKRLSGVVGTAGYLAPEAVESGTYSPATDRYALGAVAYFLLTGAEPPITHQPEALRAALAAVPALGAHPEAVGSVMAMLDADPDARPSGLANWVGQLRRSSLPDLPEELSPQAPSRHPPALPTRGIRTRVVARLSRRALVAGGLGLLLLGAAAGTTLALAGHSSPQRLVLSSGSSTTATSAARHSYASASTSAAGTRSAQVPDSTVSSGSLQVLTGTVRDSAGNPVAGAYVIGLDSLTVARTDPSGVFSMPCELTTNGVAGQRAEPLVASTWLLPIVSPGQGSVAVGQDTTSYGPPPSTPGLSYAFSGGAADAAAASIATCNGQGVDFVLGPGGNADIRLLGPTGGPVSTSAVPPDNLYLPGLGNYAALETTPLSADGYQRLGQMAAGVLRIDGTTSTLDCSGPGVVSDPAVAGADVTITAGQTTSVTCRETSNSSTTTP